MENKVIILGVNHESTLGFVRCFGEVGIKPICVLYGANEGVVFSSKYPSLIHWERNAERCLDYITLNYLNITPKPFLFGSNDDSASIINKNYNHLKDNFYIESANDKEGEIIRLMDKWVLYKMASKYGLKVESTILLNKDDQIPSDIQYPIFTKSMRTIDGGKVDEKICNNQDDLVHFLQDCHSHKIMVQRFIDKKEEFNYYGYSCKGEVYIPYEDHRPRSVAGVLSGYHVFTPVVKNELYNKVISLMHATRYEGLFSVEFLVDRNDNYIFMEVNFRHDGATYLLKPGVNLPFDYYKSVLGIPREGIRAMNKIIGLRELLDYKQFVKTGKISIFQWIIDFFTADSRMLFNLKDIGPFLFLIRKLFVKM